MTDPELRSGDAPASPDPTPDERNIALLAHLGVLAGYLVGIGHILVPLVVWLMKKDESEFIAEHARESLNFQISMTLWLTISTLLSFVLIGLPMLVIFGLIDLVCVVLATVKASNGEHYRYPLTIRLVS